MSAGAIADSEGAGVRLLTGLTWVPTEALRASLGEPDLTAQEALVTISIAMDLDFVFVPAQEPWALAALNELHDRGVAVAWAVSGVFGRVASRVGWMQALRLSAREPDVFVQALDQPLCDALASVHVGIAAGADIVVLADDLAGATGMLLSPDVVLDSLMPCYRRVVLATAGTGVPVIFHSDGDIRPLMPALAGAGFSGIHLAGLTGDALITAHHAVRAAGLIVYGGVDAQSLSGGPRGAGAQAARLALAGGMAVCDDGGITTAQEIAAFMAALETARDVFRSERER